MKTRKSRKVLVQEAKEASNQAWELFYSLDLITDYLLDRFQKLGILDKFPETENATVNLILAIAILENHQSGQ